MFSLHQSGRHLLNAVVIAICLWLLLPTTLFFTLGLFASVAGIYQHQQFNGSWLFFTAVLMIPGAGLSAVWWLTFAFPSIKGLSSIPKVVWAGLLVGIAFATLFFAISHPRLAEEFATVGSASHLLMGTLSSGGGPVLASILLVTGARLRQFYVENFSNQNEASGQG
jgi:hypothetical protein